MFVVVFVYLSDNVYRCDHYSMSFYAISYAYDVQMTYAFADSH